jgi:cytochrome c oxidase subunit IV
MLHGLGGLAYWCRWCHYYLLTISATVEDHIKLQKYTKINKIAFFVIVGAGILVIILNFAAMVMRQFALIYVIIFLTFIGVFLQVIVTMFISKMKQFLLHSSNQKEAMMKKVPIIRLYSYLITFSLAFRVLSLIIDTIIQQRFQWDSPSDDPSIERWTPNGMLYR